jgi:SPOR domain
MAAHIGQPTRSRRFIKVYLMTWAMLAVGAVAYLALLAFPQQAAAPPPDETADRNPAKTTAPGPDKTLAEVSGSLTEIRKDVTHLQDAMGERVANEKSHQSRLTALEERVTGIEPPQTPPATAPSPKPDKSARRLPDDVTTADILAKTKEETATPPPVKIAAPPPVAPIETGSINSKDEIVFGEAVVTPATTKDFAVQLAAGPSLQVLRQSWSQLVERHGGALATLKPRIVAPRSEGGIYRLLAGPVPTKAEADRICAGLGVGPKACFVTAYAGSPL